MAFIKRGLTILLAFLMMAAILPQNVAKAASDWEQVSPLPTANSIVSVAYGNNQFVAVGQNQVILTSVDGSEWVVSDHPQQINSRLLSVSYGNGRFVVVGSSGLILTLEDGETEWKVQRQNITTYAITSIVFSNGMFVAVGAEGKVMTSSDGVTWTGQTVVDTSYYHMSVTYGNNKFVGVGIRGVVIQSSDGSTWSAKPVSNTTFYGVTYGNNKYVAVGQGGLIMTSTDATNWDRATSNTSASLNAVVYDNVNNLYVATGGGGTILTSADGTTWTSRTTGTLKDITGIGCGNGTCVAVGYSGTILTSGNGIAWTDQLKGTAAELTSLSYGKGTFVAVGSEAIGSTTWNGVILTSLDGKAWTSRTITDQANKPDYIRSVSYGNGKFIALGNKWGADLQGVIMVSSDGTSWTAQTFGSDAPLGSVYGNQQYVIVGANGTILTSPDGETWTSKTSGTSNQLYGVSYGNGLYVAVGDRIILTSSDGEKWVVRELSSSDYLYNVAYGNGMFVAVGEGGRILTSSDGETWTSQTSPVYRNTLFSIHYDESGFKAAGSNGTLLTSADGTTWMQETSDTDNLLQDFISSGNEDVVVGHNGMILRRTVTNSAINPTTGNFDKNTSSPDYKDVTTTLTWNGNELAGITNRAAVLVPDTDYTVSGSSVTISKEYLAKQAVGTTSLSFTFSRGASQTLAIAISDSTPQFATVSYAPGDHGTISRTSEQVEIGGHPASVPTVTPDEGYHFAGWSSDGGITKLSGQEVAASTVTADVTYTAYYTVFVMGDADGDGKVTAADALLLSKYIKGKITLTPEQLQALDMNGDGKWDDEDVKAILAVSVGKG